ncbi:MAG TPA: hypothetical protein VIM89_07550 [Mucilaginibacter sp.]
MENQSRKILIAVIFVILLINSSIAQQQKIPYNVIIDRDGFSSFDGKSYTSITIFLNNNTSETLYYKGSDCYNLLFKLKHNPYFHLATDICKDAKNSEITVPPHRSQKMELYLTMDKIPDRNVSLVVSMDLYKWTNNQVNTKTLLASSLSDSTILHYNAQHQIYYPYNDFEMLDKKREGILLNKDIYLLTDEDRKRYILKVDENQVSRPRDTVIRLMGNKTKRAKVITVPIVVLNKTNEGLKFYSMSCSWGDFFDTDSKAITIPGWNCDKNVPYIITIPPHKEFKRNVNITYDSSIKGGRKYRISMSLLKSDSTEREWFFSPEDYVRYNKIWTDEITIKD